MITRGGQRILFITNNRNALQLFEWIEDRCCTEIISDRLTEGFLLSTNPNLVISYNYIYIVSKECIDAVHGNIINMHISFLPWNRGFSPNIWSFIDDTPKGVTIHMLSEELDEGDILFQEELSFDPEKETFQTTYQVLNDRIVALFKEKWDVIISGKYMQVVQSQREGGSYHTIADLRKLKEEIRFDWSENIASFLERYKRTIT